jgi:hypothetical protein
VNNNITHNKMTRRRKRRKITSLLPFHRKFVLPSSSFPLISRQSILFLVSSSYPHDSCSENFFYCLRFSFFYCFLSKPSLFLPRTLLLHDNNIIYLAAGIVSYNIDYGNGQAREREGASMNKREKNGN